MTRWERLALIPALWFSIGVGVAVVAGLVGLPALCWGLGGAGWGLLLAVRLELRRRRR